MAASQKRARPCEGFYRTAEEGLKLENERKVRKSTPKVDKNLYEIEVCYLRQKFIRFMRA
jgi:hypothetical protein